MSKLSVILFVFNFVVVFSQQHEQYPYSCDCSSEYSPVCGSDGRTYYNDCYLACQMRINQSGLYHSHNGPCERDWLMGTNVQKPKISCNCPQVYNPVCLSDGKTYDNLCYFYCYRNYDEHLTFEHFGQCGKLRRSDVPKLKASSFCICPATVRPVCGSDGVTYVNDCTLGCEQRSKTELTKSRDGHCDPNKDIDLRRQQEKRSFDIKFIKKDVMNY